MSYQHPNLALEAAYVELMRLPMKVNFLYLKPADSLHSYVCMTVYKFLECSGVQGCPRPQRSSVCLTSQWPKITVPGRK